MFRLRRRVGWVHVCWVAHKHEGRVEKCVRCRDDARPASVCRSVCFSWGACLLWNSAIFCIAALVGALGDNDILWRTTHTLPLPSKRFVRAGLFVRVTAELKLHAICWPRVVARREICPAAFEPQ